MNLDQPGLHSESLSKGGKKKKSKFYLFVRFSKEVSHSFGLFLIYDYFEYFFFSFLIISYLFEYGNRR
jgi:hypothetical protein